MCLIGKTARYHCQPPQSGDYTQFNLRFSVQAPERMPSDPFINRSYNNLQKLLSEMRILDDSTGVLLFYFNRLSEEISKRTSGYVISIKSLCSLLFTEIIRLSNQAQLVIFPNEDLIYRGFTRVMVDEFFRSKYLTQVSIQELAEDMKVSTRQVNRILHAMFKMSFTEKLVEMRLEEAANRIIETSLPFETISRECGFNSYRYFFDCFRKKFGMSPSTFRQSGGMGSAEKDEQKIIR